MAHLLDSLNPQQRHAAETIRGPVLVLAGAGTGKTRVITYRMAYMLEQGVKPDQILAMTFTNKAAAEMRERIGGLVSKELASKLTVGTFHSFCLKTLRDYQEVMGWPKGFTICDPGDQLSVMKGALRELAIPEAAFRPQDALSLVSLAKNRMQTPETFLARSGDDKDELLGRAWERYAGALTRSRRLDFDDLLIETNRLLRMAEPKERLSGRFQYLLVDEYQDTNGAQFEIIKALARSPQEPLRGGRRRPVHLRLARGGHLQDPGLRQGLPRRYGRAAGDQTTARPRRSSTWPTA